MTTSEPPEETEVLDEIVRRIVQVADPDKIILFGSRARREADEESDHDLLIIAPSEEPTWRRTVPVLMAMRGITVPCDVLWRTSEEVEQWQAASSHVLSRAVREGRVVYERAA